MSYVWYANGSPLGGGETLPLTEWLVGKRITVSVTASLEGYVSATRTSQPTAPIASAIAPSPPHYPNAVTAGAYCAKQYEGWHAHTSTGVRVKCTTSPTDSRLRWRAI